MEFLGHPPPPPLAIPYVIKGEGNGLGTLADSPESDAM